MPPEGLDLELVARANRGDTTALADLFECYHGWALHHATRMLGDADEACDVAQELFMNLYGRFPGFVLTSTMKTFLYGVMENLCRNRRARGRQVVEFDEEIVTGDAAEPSSDAYDAANMLAQLPPDQQSLLRLRFTDDLSTAQLSELLGVPKGTVSSRLTRAVQALRDIVEAPLRRRSGAVR